MSEEFYLQDNRSFVGNDLLFWAEVGGYTTDLSKAEVFTKDAAIGQNRMRETDIPWPKAYLDAKTRPAVDVQYVELKEALEGLGIELKKPAPYVKPTYRCGGGYGGCGRMMTEQAYYSRSCVNCETDNRP